MLELNNISYKVDGKKILDDLNLKIDDGKFIVITGPNGSGKSTLAKVIMGIINDYSGKIILDGKDITKYTIDERANNGISFAFQQPVKFKGITVYDLLKIASKKEITKAEGCNILSKVGLCAKEYIDREINLSLSGGELKRIEIASAMLRETKVTIFDEPEAGIDLWSFNNLTQIFENIRNNLNGITIVISHQERILKIADEVILLKNGKIDKIGKFEDIIDNSIVNNECRKIREENSNETK